MEALNREGKHLHGFSRDEALPISGDSLRYTIAWQGRTVAHFLPASYLLRLHLTNATVYALTIYK